MCWVYRWSSVAHAESSCQLRLSFSLQCLALLETLSSRCALPLFLVVFLGFLLHLVAAVPVWLLLAERSLLFLLPPFALPRFAFRVFLLRFSPWRFRPCLDPSYSVSSPACMCDYCVVFPFSTFRLFGTSLFPVLASLSGRMLYLVLSPFLVLSFLLVRLLSLLACFTCRLFCVYACCAVALLFHTPRSLFLLLRFALAVFVAFPMLLLPTSELL